jgi:trans-aconitate methyltransferase
MHLRDCPAVQLIRLRASPSRLEAVMSEQPAAYDPVGFDPTIPNVARMYDYYLGGKDNFAADREAAEQALKLVPDLRMRDNARYMRVFLQRVVRFLVDSGIRQFIDIGCGLPTQGNVHEVAQAAAPDARVVYVDNDPVVIAHARALLETNPLTAVIRGDIREPESIFRDPQLHQLIDVERPFAILVLAVLHVFSDDELNMQITKQLRDALPSGGYLAISHAVSDLKPEATAKLAMLYQDNVVTDGPRRSNLRTAADVAPYFEGLELVEPGLVYVNLWRPDATDPSVGGENIWAVGGVGRKQ